MKRLNQTTSVIVLAAVIGASNASAQTEPDVTVNTAEIDNEESEDEARQDKVVVTGSRMNSEDPSARIETITADDIERRGLATAEDIIRSIPQNFSSLNGSTSIDSLQGPDLGLRNLGVGISTVNLRGLGSANTLLLVNGQRVAGIPGQEDFVANLRNIPASSIERVDVNLDGGSAIYGSDAIAGVVNVILKQGYTGANLSARYENSSTDGDLRRLTGFAGKDWGSGSISASFSVTEQDPVSSEEAGFVSRDYTSLYPDYSNADLRNASTLRSGGVAMASVYYLGPTLILPVGNDGTNTVASDFGAVDLANDQLDIIAKDLTPSVEDTSANLFFQQKLFDGFTVRGSASYSEAKSLMRRNSLARLYYVPDTNAFNPFGEGVYVYYSAQQEIADGLIPDNETSSTEQSLGYTLGFDYDISNDLRWVTDFSYSESEREAIANSLQSVAIRTALDDPEREARIRAALASSDPTIALNLFGDGTAQSAAFVDLYGTRYSSLATSESKQLTSYMAGRFFELPGGQVDFVFGGEVRSEGLSGDVLNQGGNDGTPDPSRDVYAAFGELLIPIVGQENAIPGVKSLTVKLDARYDTYEYEGDLGSDPDTGEVNIEQITYERLSPRIGVSWVPIDDVHVSASWAEGFRVPVFSELFSTRGSFSYEYAYDPLTGQEHFDIFTTQGPNPDLEPEVSEILNLGLKYTPTSVPGLAVQLDYSDLKIKDRIATNTDLFSVLSFEEVGNVDEIYIRDEDGNLLEVDAQPINISETISETVALDVRYVMDTKWGRFEPGLNVQYVLDHTDQATPDSDAVSNVGTTFGVDEYAASARIYWENEAWDGLAELHYTPEYDNLGYSSTELEYVKIGDVSSRTTLDASIGYEFQSGLTLRAGARNLFDAEFPNGIFGERPFDATRIDTRGRIAYFELRYDFGQLPN